VCVCVYIYTSQRASRRRGEWVRVIRVLDVVGSTKIGRRGVKPFSCTISPFVFQPHDYCKQPVVTPHVHIYKGTLPLPKYRYILYIPTYLYTYIIYNTGYIYIILCAIYIIFITNDTYLTIHNAHNIV